MPDTLTTNYGFTQPEVGGSNDTWGDKLNADLASIDTLIHDLRAAVTALQGAAGLTLADFTANYSILAKSSTGTLLDVAAAAGSVFGRRATGEITAMDYATLKTDLALNNVENYSRAQLKTYFDTLYAPVGSGGGGTISGQPADDTLTAVATTGINATQIWVGTGVDALTLKTLSPYMAGLLATADVATLQTAIGAAAISAQSLASPGYMKLSNGLIIQWGQITVAANGRPTTNFPTAFASFAIAVGSGGPNDTSASGNCRVVAVTTANFQVCNNSGSSIPFWWIAVGK